eukprot:TRINITY_DN7246_c0_g1_i1.p1 TRINITY_DN7246_c0_g1~~TRINITY_DN7246_c0_g1_i1.p1  ORF type:complete len:334 (-),score=68.98 TRINITY_DN7246_c0_g1_i1:72-1073(-)
MSYVMYINLSIINTAQIQRNNEAKNLLRQYGIIEEKTINCGAKTSIILDLKNRFGKLEYPLIEIDNKPIGTLKNLELYLKTNKINDIIKNAEYQSHHEDSGEDSKDENDRLEKIQENDMEEIYSIILKSEDVIKKEIQIKQIIQQKKELIDKISEKEKTEVSGVLSYPLHLLETTYKSTINGIFSYFKSSDKSENKDCFEIPVLKTNWYGRVQKRFLNFYCDRIERVDSQNKICQVYPFHQMSKIYFTDKFFFHLLAHNGIEDLYQISPFFLAPVLDLFGSIHFVNSDFVLQFEQDLSEIHISDENHGFVSEQDPSPVVLTELPLPREDDRDI